MTPRERLEAAGWKARYPEAEARWFSPDISDSATYSQKEALAQLARDGAKETSDGGEANMGGIRDGITCRDAGGIPDGDRSGNENLAAPPVATSVSAPESAEQFYAKSAFNFVWYRSNGDIFEFAEAYAREYSSSSSAALQSQLDDKLYCDGCESELVRESCNYVRSCDKCVGSVFQFEAAKVAAEAKVAELALNRDEWEEQAAQWMNKFNAAEDSRARLQEALRAAANHLHYVGQEQAAGQARKALGDPKKENGQCEWIMLCTFVAKNP